MYEATERTMDFAFPENGIYIVKPTIATADKQYQYIWGDSVHLTGGGAKRMGRSPHGLIVSEAKPFGNVPKDITVYS